ncbi:unnamed protein product [Rotaria socialis]|uniref:Uncharacterized protein n=1 Tax=Rotaria socialis TaxID=392032 RepID=A0A818HVG3_9BILA|nr:unnamed protein product [Rotaria socialis]CAF4334141.1 unnamed protein product [Rotaria socialis]CAF4555084.1 unnamed protein product [Rotaria socialis]
MMNKKRKRNTINSYQLTEYENFIKFQQLVRAYSSEEHAKSAPMFYGLNASPLGLCAFALTTFVVSMYLAGATVPVGASMGVVMGAALFYGGVVQILGGYLEYREGNNFGALTFCSYGAFWLSFASLDVAAFNFLVGYKDPEVLSNAFGVFFLGWTIFTALMFLSSLRTNLVTSTLFFCLLITFILLTSSKFLLGHQNLQRASGAFGILTASLAWYSGFSQLLNKSNWFFKWPLFAIRHRPATDAEKLLEPA